MQPAQLTFLMIGQKSDGSGGRAVDKSASAHSRLHNQSYGQLCTSCSEVAGRGSSYSHGQTGGKSRDSAGGVGANLLGRLVFWKILAGEPGFAAKLNVIPKSLKTLMLPVANLATWTMSVANGQGRLVVRRVVMRGQVLASPTALEPPRAAD